MFLLRQVLCSMRPCDNDRSEPTLAGLETLPALTSVKKPNPILPPFPIPDVALPCLKTKWIRQIADTYKLFFLFKKQNFALLFPQGSNWAKSNLY